MGDQRAGGISWTDETWNPIRGCSRVSPGCDHCYAIRQAARSNRPGGAYEGLTREGPRGLDWSGQVRFVDDVLLAPLAWQRPRRIFPSMTDFFHPSVPFDWVDKILAVMAKTPRHTLQILTKRPERMRDYWSDIPFRIEQIGIEFERLFGLDRRRRDGQSRWTWPLPNVWLGTSCEDQKRADERIPHLRATPAAVRFVSLEPLLGAISLTAHIGGHSLDLVIVGGESGLSGARPMHPAWPLSLLEQCERAGVPFHFKQWGEWAPVTVVRDPEIAGGWGFDSRKGGRASAEFFLGPVGAPRRGRGWRISETLGMERVGKHLAGRTLRGAIWDQMPRAASGPM